MFSPIAVERDKCAVGNFAVNFLVSSNVLSRHGVVNVLRNLRADVDDAQGVNHIFHAVTFAERRIFYEVTREVDMRAELPWKFERLNQTIKHGIAPIKAGFAELNRTFRDA